MGTWRNVACAVLAVLVIAVAVAFGVSQGLI